MCHVSKYISEARKNVQAIFTSHSVLLGAPLIPERTYSLPSNQFEQLRSFLSSIIFTVQNWDVRLLPRSIYRTKSFDLPRGAMNI